MKKLWLVIIVATTLVLLCGSARSQVDPKEVPNFHIVDSGVARGAQPTKIGLVALSKLGCKTIINLRGKGKAVDDEKRIANLLGIEFFNIPLPNHAAPKNDDILLIQKILLDKSRYPIFVHCKLGKDRTGTVIAIYRQIQYGWPNWMALAEAKHYGLHWYNFGMKSYLNSFMDINNGKTRSKEAVKGYPQALFR